MSLETFPFDAAQHLDAEGQAELVADAIESGDAAYISHALNIVARARGMSSVASHAGVTPEALYRALGPDGDPSLSTLLGIIGALEVKLSGTLAGERPGPAPRP
jgi:probable addiction module antidote protein